MGIISCSDFESRTRTGLGAYPYGGVIVTTRVGYSGATLDEPNWSGDLVASTEETNVMSDKVKTKGATRLKIFIGEENYVVKSLLYFRKSPYISIGKSRTIICCKKLTH
jgi:hypothetical protein